jgi:nucleotide-binding universal stress UspA family protein
MYQHILIATDGSEMGERSVAHGLALAAVVKAKVTIVTVTEQWSALDIAVEARRQNPNPIQQFETMANAQAATILEEASSKARAAGVTFDTVHVRDRYPAEGIVETAQQEQCDLIVMSSHGRRGIGRIVLGSQAYEVLTNTKIPVLIVR